MDQKMPPRRIFSRTPGAFFRYPAIAACILALLSCAEAPESEPVAAEESGVDLPTLAYEQFQLANGLEVVLHEDHSRPLVAVGVWYRVGSSYEWQGRTGLAHLIEHLMFEGSTGMPENYFRTIEDTGATDINGTTSRDRTSYFQTVPKDALDRVLWLEADRMGWMLNDPQRLERQIGVVNNEKQLHQSAPYGTVRGHLMQLLYGKNHPYAWPVLGFDLDLAEISVEDVARFRNAWYAPNNAVLVLAGDFDTEKVKDSLQTYFKRVARKPVPAAPEAELPELKANRTRVIEDRVAYPRLYRVWPVPAAAQTDKTSALFLACRLLGGGHTSLLYRHFVLEKKLANFASCHSDFGRLAGEFTLVMEARDPEALKQIEAQLDGLLDGFLSSPPEWAAIDGLVQAEVGSMLRSADKLGGYAGKLAQLAEGAVLADNPDLWRQEFAALESQSPENLLKETAVWLKKPWVQLTVMPGTEPAEPPPVFASRAHLPEPELIEEATSFDEAPAIPSLPGMDPLILEPADQWHLSRPCPEDADDCIPTELDVYLIHRDHTPLLSLDFQFPCLRDPELESAGLSDFAVHMMSQGTRSYPLAGLTETLRNLALGWNLYARPDYCGLTADLPASNLAQALPVIEELVFSPRFDDADLEREQERWVSRIASEYSSARTLALRLLPPLIYGDNHPYGVPGTGTGYAVPIASLLADDLSNWHRVVFRRDRGSLIIAGNLSGERRQNLLAELQDAFQADAAPVKTVRSTVAGDACTSVAPTKPAGKVGRLIFIPTPGKEQAVIVTGQPLLERNLKADLERPLGACSRAALEMAGAILGGSITGRLAQSLRLDKGWSYGSRGIITDPRGTPLAVTFTSVQLDKTAEAVREIVALGQGLGSDSPPEKAEWQRVRNGLLRKMPGQLESLFGLRAMYSDVIGKKRHQNGRESNWWNQNRTSLIRDLRLTEVRQQARRIDPSLWTVIVVADPNALQSLQQLKLAEVEIQEMEIPGN